MTYNRKDKSQNTNTEYTNKLTTNFALNWTEPQTVDSTAYLPFSTLCIWIRPGADSDNSFSIIRGV